MALEAMPVLDGRQLGVGERPLSVVQMPPPAAPTQMRQAAAVQELETARAVSRPEITVGRSGAVTGAGTLVVVGPISCQDCPSRPKARRATDWKALYVLTVC